MGPRSRLARLRASDRRHAWKPFTAMSAYLDSEPLVFESARGHYLRDASGRRYFDGVSSIWCNLQGHRVGEIDAAIRAQMSKVAHVTMLGPTHPGAIDLAEALVRIAPRGRAPQGKPLPPARKRLTRVFFSDDGSTAVEVALKMAFQFWKQRRPARPRKERFLCFSDAYHGDTLGAVSVGGIGRFHAVFGPLLFKSHKVPMATCYRCPLGKRFPSCKIACLDEAERILERHADRIAAVVLEPKVHGAAGMIIQPEGYIRRVRAMCDRHDVLLIADEVATGFGRTGRMFACDLEGVRPDLLCLAKGLTGGYLPLAATLATEEIFEAFLGPPESGRMFTHGHTYGGNPLGCAAALANLRRLRAKRIVEGVDAKGKALERALAPLASHPNVGDIRRAGLMCGIELVSDRATRRPFPPAERPAHRVADAALRRGLWIRPLGDVVILMPPLTVTPREIAWLGRVVREAVEEVLP
ncbi:MAG: adenosylmethionine--8-amino-7-oxononanoate transaminase [Planctomycetes bacterium]|nr:adenosylmethionine--8-amino-7-oxononanoate transaminase [Planctomycetota bacterium]